MDASHNLTSTVNVDPAPVESSSDRVAALVPFRLEYFGPGAVATAVDRAMRAPGKPVRIDVVSRDAPQSTAYGQRWIVFDRPHPDDRDVPSLRWAEGPDDPMGSHAVIGSYQPRSCDRGYLAATITDHLRADFRQSDAIIRVDPGSEHLQAGLRGLGPQEIISVLMKIEDARLHGGMSSDWHYRVAAAIVASAANCSDRSSWSDHIPASDPDIDRFSSRGPSTTAATADPSAVAAFRKHIDAGIITDITGRTMWHLLREDGGYSLWRAADLLWNPDSNYSAATPDGGKEFFWNRNGAERILERLKSTCAIADDDGGTRPTV